MINVIDRVPQDPNQWQMTDSTGKVSVVTLIRDDNPAQVGTPVNRALFNDLRGFAPKNTTFGSDGSITETDPVTGVSLKTVFNANGTITETYGTTNGPTVTKTTTFNADGSISEVVA